MAEKITLTEKWPEVSSNQPEVVGTSGAKISQNIFIFTPTIKLINKRLTNSNS